MLAALTAALNSQSRASIVRLQGHSYAISNTLTLTSYKQLLEAGMDKTFIKWLGPIGGTVVNFFFSAPAYYAQLNKISDLSVHGNGTAAIGINLSGCSESVFEKVIAKSFTDTGWYGSGSANGTNFDTPVIYNTFRNCEVYNATGVGNYGFRILNAANSNSIRV